MELVYELENIDKAAGELYHAVKGRNVFAFTGDMGSGKTTFIHSLCRRMGVKTVMGSPTFSIINEYESENGPVYHIDLYRCRDEDEAIKAGVEDCLFSGCTCMVEWSSKAPSLFPDETIRIGITAINEHTRKITVT
ncbi:MAG TPA: tRNA (adenosine(37)-N6)-threonylcarbamoyltransferase complex ATPase subunit type 1 TsaE [Flavitalea sp.]|nr:tRNA (adenosine(37)-N6)-threonylcarbamoyltransferase complex ATPase subunit type 1 TsaE [Flavitalea sp.]